MTPVNLITSSSESRNLKDFIGDYSAVVKGRADK